MNEGVLTVRRRYRAANNTLHFVSTAAFKGHDRAGLAEQQGDVTLSLYRRTDGAPKHRTHHIDAINVAHALPLFSYTLAAPKEKRSLWGDSLVRRRERAKDRRLANSCFRRGFVSSIV